MKFTLTIDLGDDAMQTGDDIANALRGIAVLVAEEYGSSPAFPDIGRVADVNGNTVGTWKVTR